MALGSLSDMPMEVLMDMFKEDIDSFRDEELGNGLVDEDIARMLADNNGKIMPVIEVLLARKREEKMAREREFLKTAREQGAMDPNFSGTPFDPSMYNGQFPQAGSGFPQAGSGFPQAGSGFPQAGGVYPGGDQTSGNFDGSNQGTSGQGGSEPQLRFPRGTTPQQAEQWKNSYSQLVQMGYVDDGFMMDVIAQCNGSVAKAVEFLGAPTENKS